MAHQPRRGLQVPIGVGDMGMPQISGQRQRVARHVGGRTLAVFQRSHGKAVTQIVYPRLGYARALRQRKGSEQRVESPIDHGLTAWPAGV